MLKRTLFAVLTLAGAARLDAQWSIQPDGSAQYTANLSISAAFKCPLDPFFPNICDLIPNGVRITNGTAWADITFAGATGPVTVTNTAGPFLLGSYTFALGGVGPMTWPTSAAATIPLFESRLFATVAVPSALTIAIGGYGFVRTDPGVFTHNCCNYFPPYGSVPFTAQPVGLSYTTMIARTIGTPAFDVTRPGTQDVYAEISLVPEPTTFVLIAAGLGALAFSRRRPFALRSSDQPPA